MSTNGHRKSNRGYKNRGEGEIRGELGDAEAARGRAGDVKGDGEGGEDDLNGEVEQVHDDVAVAILEELRLDVGELLRRSNHLRCALPHFRVLPLAGGLSALVFLPQLRN